MTLTVMVMSCLSGEIATVWNHAELKIAALQVVGDAAFPGQH